MRLFTISIVLPHVSSAVRLTYTDETRSREIMAAILSPKGAIGMFAPEDHVYKDDYGHEVFVKPGSPDMVMWQDEAQNANGNAELTIFNAHAQIKLNKRAEQDEILREAGRQQQRQAPLLAVPPGNFNGPRN